jgi:hypothetical protein
MPEVEILWFAEVAKDSKDLGKRFFVIFLLNGDIEVGCYHYTPQKLAKVKDVKKDVLKYIVEHLSPYSAIERSRRFCVLSASYGLEEQAPPELLQRLRERVTLESL